VDDRKTAPDELDRRIADAKAGLGKSITDAEGRAESRGWGIDHYAGWGTAPWAMIVFLILGFAAGTRRAMQTSAQFDADPTNDKTKQG
jgi:ATP synthase protein I